jgi:hypothetical protein
MMIKMERTARLACAATLLVSAAGCFGGSEPGPGGCGERCEGGNFVYACVADGDAVCNVSLAVDAEAVSELGVNQQKPEAVAVGARFGLSFSGVEFEEDGELLIVDTVPASPDHVDTTGGFTIHDAGLWGFLARNPRGITVDFIHVLALEPAELEVWMSEQKVTGFQMMEQTEAQLGAIARDEGGIALAGALGYTWTSSDETVLVVDSIANTGTPAGGIEVNDDEVRVVALAAGSATLTLERGDLTHTVDVTVVAAGGM